MITIGLEQATLDQCLDEAQHERVVITRNGKPIALFVNIEGLDEEQAGASERETCGFYSSKLTLQSTTVFKIFGRVNSTVLNRIRDVLQDLITAKS